MGFNSGFKGLTEKDKITKWKLFCEK